jgi:hypothetical protein
VKIQFQGRRGRKKKFTRASGAPRKSHSAAAAATAASTSIIYFSLACDADDANF